MQNYRMEVVGDKKESYIALLKELQLIVTESIEIVVNHFKGAHISKSVAVAIVILKRLVESTKSGELLISNEYFRDASILVTNQIELRLDLQYISQDNSRAETWLSHTHEHKKPWRVAFLLEKLFTGQEFDAEKDLYKRFSMVKHGNPASDMFGFPYAITDNQIHIDSNYDALLAKFSLYAFIFFSELYRTFSAGMVLFRPGGYDLEQQENKAVFLNHAMSDLNVNSTREQLQFLDKLNPTPELCKSCRTVPENKISIYCVMKRSNQNGRFECDNFKSE